MSNNDILKNIAQRAKRRLVGRENLPVAKIKVITTEDEVFKNKVENLLSQNEVVTNPVHFLIDDKIFANLADEAKERYLLSTLDKYTNFKNQIENIASYSKFCM